MAMECWKGGRRATKDRSARGAPFEQYPDWELFGQGSWTTVYLGKLISMEYSVTKHWETKRRAESGRIGEPLRKMGWRFEKVLRISQSPVSAFEYCYCLCSNSPCVTASSRVGGS